MKEKIEKNISVLRYQYGAWREEIDSLNWRMYAATYRRDWREMAHIAVGYVEETIDQMPRLWAYTWLPKWALVAYLIWL